MDDTVASNIIKALETAGLAKTVKVLKEELSEKKEDKKIDVLATTAVTASLGNPAFVCTYPGCNRSFSCRGNLNRHKKVHSSVKPYKCKFCDKSFSRKDDLNAHIQTHAAIVPITCPICRGKFKRMTGFKSHLSKKHNMSLSDLPQNVADQINRDVTSAQKEREEQLQAADVILRLPREDESSKYTSVDLAASFKQQQFPGRPNDQRTDAKPLHDSRISSSQSLARGSTEKHGKRSRPWEANSNNAELERALQAGGPDDRKKMKNLFQPWTKTPGPLLKFGHEDHHDWLLNTGKVLCTKKKILRYLDHQDLKAVDTSQGSAHHHHHHHHDSEHQNDVSEYKVLDPCTLSDCPTEVHRHDAGCGHPIVMHDDHIDVIVDGQLHHQSSLNNECEVHGSLNILPADEQEFDQWFSIISQLE